MEETWFYMRASNKFSQKDKTSDKITLNASSKIEEKCLQALVDAEGGILKPGAMPKVQTASAQGCKKLMDAVAKAGVWSICLFLRHAPEYLYI